MFLDLSFSFPIESCALLTKVEMRSLSRNAMEIMFLQCINERINRKQIVENSILLIINNEIY